MNIEKNEFYVVILGDSEVCYDIYPSLAIYPTFEMAEYQRNLLHARYPTEKYSIRKMKLKAKS